LIYVGVFAVCFGVNFTLTWGILSLVAKMKHWWTQGNMR